MTYNSEVQPVKSDVSSLATLKKSAASTGAYAGSATNIIPKPKVKWKSRIILPATILLILFSLIGWSMQDMILPTIEVQVIPAVTQYAGSSITIPSKTAKSNSADNQAAEPVKEQTSSTKAPIVASVDSRAKFGVSLAQLKSLKVLTKGSGWLEASPFETNATALTHGIIKKILVLEGQTVTKGQPIAEMIDDDAKLELAQAKSTYAKSLALVEAAKAQLKSAQLHWDNPIEQKRKVQTTSAAISEAKAELKKVTSEIKAQVAKLGILKDDFDRSKQGYENNVIASTVYQKSKFAYQQQQATVDATKQTKKIISAKIKRLISENQAAALDLKLRIEQEKGLAIAKAKLAEANASLTASETKLATAKLRLSRMIVRAPISGVVMKLEKIPGAKLMIQADDKLSAVVAKIYDPKKLQARIDVQLSNVAKVFIGQYVRITASIDASDDKKVFLGKVVRMLHLADVQKNTLEVKVELQNPSLLLKPDMIVRAEFFTPVQEDSSQQIVKRSATSQPKQTATSSIVSSNDADLKIMVPKELVFKSEAKKDCVLIVDPATKTALLQEVTLGEFEKENWIEIAKGVSQGDRIIATNPSTIKPGSRVKIIGEFETIK